MAKLWGDGDGDLEMDPSGSYYLMPDPFTDGKRMATVYDACYHFGYALSGYVQDTIDHGNICRAIVIISFREAIKCITDNSDADVKNVFDHSAYRRLDDHTESVYDDLIKALDSYIESSGDDDARSVKEQIIKAWRCSMLFNEDDYIRDRSGLRSFMDEVDAIRSSISANEKDGCMDLGDGDTMVFGRFFSELRSGLRDYVWRNNNYYGMTVALLLMDLMDHLSTEAGYFSRCDDADADRSLPEDAQHNTIDREYAQWKAVLRCDGSYNCTGDAKTIQGLIDTFDALWEASRLQGTNHLDEVDHQSMMGIFSDIDAIRTPYMEAAWGKKVRSADLRERISRILTVLSRDDIQKRPESMIPYMKDMQLPQSVIEMTETVISLDRRRFLLAVTCPEDEVDILVASISDDCRVDRRTLSDLVSGIRYVPRRFPFNF